MSRIAFIGLAFSVLAGFTTSASAATDLEKGKALYEECKGCHGLTDNVVGPRHCGVVGRVAGSVPDFQYSDVMKTSKIVWTDEKLHAFLTSPFTYLSGTNMGYAGLYDVAERNDLIAYLHQVSEDPTCADVPGDAKGKH